MSKFKLPGPMQKAISAEVAQAFAREMASRPAPAQPAVPGKGAKSFTREEIRAAVGLRIKSLWMTHPLYASKATDAARQAVQKAASAYESVYGQGGSLLSQEYSSEVIELLYPSTVLLRAGALKQTFVGKLNVGRLNGGATAAFVAEGVAPPINKLETGAVILEGHKLMGLWEPSNDLLRNPNVDTAGVLGNDLMTAMGVVADRAGFIGDGTGANPKGIIKQVKAANKIPGVAITQANLNNVIRFIDTFEQKVKASNLVLEGNKPFWAFSSAVELALKGLRFESGGFVYREQLDQGKLNGKPVFITETFGDNYIFFGLANQLWFGLDTATGDIILDMSQPHFAEDLTMMKGVTKVDWKVRHDTAFAYSDNVTLS